MPLSRVNSLFCAVTALLPLAMNLKTKYWFYEKANQFVCLIWRKDKEARNFIKKPKTLQYVKSGRAQENLDEEPGHDIILSAEEQTLQEQACYANVALISLFFSFFLNFVYQLFLQEVVTDGCELLIKAADKLGLEIHFLRYLYLALFETRPPQIWTRAHATDCLILGFAVIPAFVIGLRFWTAAVYINYTLRINSFIVLPLMALCFVANDQDITCLLLLVTYMNVSAFLYHTNPPENIYVTARTRRFRSQEVEGELFK